MKYVKNLRDEKFHPSYEENVVVLAEDIDEALELGYDYAESLSSGSMTLYEIVGVKQKDSVFLGLEDELEEVELPESGK